MTVSNTTNKLVYTGNGSTTVFPYTFKVFDSEELVVKLYTIADGTTTTLTETTHYTVSGVGNDTGGNVTTLTAYSSSYKLIILRTLPLTQEIDYVENDPFPASTHEEGLDRTAMRDQQLSEALDRCIKVDETQTGLDLTLPPPSAGKALKWNAAADGLENSTSDPDVSAAAAATSASAAATSATAAASSASSASTSATAAAASAVTAAAASGTWRGSFCSVKTTDYTIDPADYGYSLMMNSATARTFTLPDISGNALVLLKNIGTANCTIAKHVSDTLDITTLTQNQSVILIADTSNNKWRSFVNAEYNEGGINIVLDGGGATLTTGVKLDVEVPFNGTIVESVLLADQTGSIVIDLWKDTYANFPPTVGDTITASAKPTLSSATKATDSTLTGWTKTLTKGDIIRVNIDSVSTLTRATLSLKIRKT